MMAHTEGTAPRVRDTYFFMQNKRFMLKICQKLNFEIHFLARKIYQYGSTVYQKIQNSNIWGGIFSKKKLLESQLLLGILSPRG